MTLMIWHDGHGNIVPREDATHVTIDEGDRRIHLSAKLVYAKLQAIVNPSATDPDDEDTESPHEKLRNKYRQPKSE